MESRSKTRARCEAAWREGMPLKVTSDGVPILMKPSMNCEYVVKGTQDIAYVGFPDVPKEELIPRLRKFLTTIPRLTAEELEEAEDGIYTWVYASKGAGEPTFYASRTAVMLELGTVHYSIATAVGATTVHGAGELWKHSNEMTFNFLSGTFMEKWILPEGCTLNIMEEVLKEKLKETFAYVRRAKGLAFRKTDPTFIDTRFLELTTAELEGYVKAGFKVCIHDKSNKAECKSTKSACKKPMERVEDMKGGVPPTPRRPARQGSENLTQFAEAKRMLQFGQLARPEPTAVAPVPTSRVEGMGGRKTKKTKRSRRKTRRVRRRGGGDEDENPDWEVLDPKHVGVRMATQLLDQEPRVTHSRQAAMLRIMKEFPRLSPKQIRDLDAYSHTVPAGADLEARLRARAKSL